MASQKVRPTALRHFSALAASIYGLAFGSLALGGVWMYASVQTLDSLA